MTDTHDQSDSPTTPTKISGFTQMSLVTLQRIVQTGGGYRDMAAYIVLCSGVNGKANNRASTHGAKSIADRSGMTYRMAEKTLEWLQDAAIIKPAENLTPPDSKRPKASVPRWDIFDERLDVAVARQFTERYPNSTRTDTPLQRMIEGINGNDDIPRSQAVMDAILLYATLLKEQDFGGFAGVDPNILHGKFVPIDPTDVHCERSEDTLYEYEPVVVIPEINSLLVTVRATDKYKETPWTTTKQFIFDLLGNPARDQITELDLIEQRFWWSLRQLRDIRLVYCAAILWEGDPTSQQQCRTAEPLATHTIEDAWAKDYDPSISKDINRLVWRNRLVEDFANDGNGGSYFVSKGANHYRYIVNKKRQNHVHLIRQLRVQHWAANESTVHGRTIERARTTKVQETYAKIKFA
jgi:hypothetical protein